MVGFRRRRILYFRIKNQIPFFLTRLKKEKKNLGLKEISTMDNRVFEIINQDVQKDWYIQETIIY